jgi:hypothetical protein
MGDGEDRGRRSLWETGGRGELRGIIIVPGQVFADRPGWAWSCFDHGRIGPFVCARGVPKPYPRLLGDVPGACLGRAAGVVYWTGPGRTGAVC